MKGQYELPMMDAYFASYKSGDAVPTGMLSEYIEKLRDQKDFLEERLRSPARQQFNTKINNLVHRYTGLSYKQFLAAARPESIDDHTFGGTVRGDLRRRIFSTRAQMYLGALSDYEHAGGSLLQVLEEARVQPLPFVKQDAGPEPALEYIYRAFRDHDAVAK